MDYHLKVINNRILLDTIEIYSFIPVEGGESEIGGEPALVRNSGLGKHFVSEKKYIKSFLIGKTPVTLDLWNYVYDKTTPDFTKRVEVEGAYVGEISYEEWMSFIEKLNYLTGRRFRLPNNDEWEYAARGGRLSKGYKYSGGNKLDEVALLFDVNESDRGLEIFKKGKLKKPNELGLYDMSGGVWEVTSSTLQEVDKTARKIALLYPHGRAVFDNMTNEKEDSIIRRYSMHISKGGSAASPADNCALDSPPQVVNFTGARLILEY